MIALVITDEIGSLYVIHIYNNHKTDKQIMECDTAGRPKWDIGRHQNKCEHLILASW